MKDHVLLGRTILVLPNLLGIVYVGRLDKDTNQTLSKSLIQVGQNTQKIFSVRSEVISNGHEG
jgi:hypothetical protein